MPEFKLKEPIKTPDPTIEVTVSERSPLAVGEHTFSLVVVDDAGNESIPAEVSVVVKDTQAPTAVISAPKTVAPGASFTLDGTRSADLPPGKITTWIWTMVS
jgi:hypothetical protein